MYSLAVDFAPVYELLVSYSAFAVSKHHRLMDLGPAWVRRVAATLPADVAARLAHLDDQDADELLSLGLLLAWQAPFKGEVPAFIGWCASLSGGDIYDLVSQWYMPSCTIPANLRDMRDALISRLEVWHQHYYSHLPQAVLDNLFASASTLRGRIDSSDPQSLVEEVSNGVRLIPAPDVAKVILIPQYHLRPWNLLSPYRGTTILSYPLELLAAKPGEPDAQLQRAAKAFGDGGRLRMMRFLAGGERSFTEIVAELGLANSTVNYHLGLLRTAGLVSVLTDAAVRGAPQYALRSEALGQHWTGWRGLCTRASDRRDSGLLLQTTGAGVRGGATMKELEFRNHCRSRGLDDRRTAQAIEAVRRLESDLAMHGLSLDAATATDLQTYFDTLIAAGLNTNDELLALMRYFHLVGLNEAFVYTVGVLGGRSVIPSIARRTEEVAGDAVRAAVFDGLLEPPLGASQQAYPAVTGAMLERLQAAVSPETCRRILAGNHHQVPTAAFEPLRALYLAEGIDAVLAKRHASLLADLEEHAKSGKPWYEQQITPEIVAFVRADPEIQSGVRHGNKIMVSKIPYSPVAYLAAEGQVERRYYQCHCPLARAAILANGPGVDPVLCNCSGGYEKLPFDVIFGQETTVEVLESALGGSTKCRFAITIPDGLAGVD